MIMSTVFVALLLPVKHFCDNKEGIKRKKNWVSSHIHWTDLDSEPQCRPKLTLLILCIIC